jgi:hypothetical protein
MHIRSRATKLTHNLPHPFVAIGSSTTKAALQSGLRMTPPNTSPPHRTFGYLCLYRRTCETCGSGNGFRPQALI